MRIVEGISVGISAIRSNKMRYLPTGWRPRDSARSLSRSVLKGVASTTKLQKPVCILYMDLQNCCQLHY